MAKEITMKDYGNVITKLINKQNLSKEQATEMFLEILENKQSLMQQGAFLAAISAKGATAQEVAGSFEAIYKADTNKVSPITSMPVVDNCGSGMDSFKTFNISTGAAIIAAAAGIPMARHGSRFITSVCGTVDILEKLGIDMDTDVSIVKNSIEKSGIGVFNGMSSKVHPVALGRILSQISFGSVLNISASLANPALPQYAVRGVYSQELLEFVPEIMKEIGYKKAIVLYGTVNGNIIDEASTAGITYVKELKQDGSIESYNFNAKDFGIPIGSLDELKTFNTAEESALSIVKLLKNKETDTRRDIVALNAGLILYLTQKATTIKEGYEKSIQLIENGKAFEQLTKWVTYQNTDKTKGWGVLNNLEKKIC